LFESDHFKYRSGGIRLHYDTTFDNPSGLKEGILLEVGFDDTQPNMPRTISSWIYDRAQETDIAVIDNRARRNYRPSPLNSASNRTTEKCHRISSVTITTLANSWNIRMSSHS
jgi:hypothetical protein